MATRTGRQSFRNAFILVFSVAIMALTFYGCGGGGGGGTSPLQTSVTAADTGTLEGTIVPEAGAVLGRESGREAGASGGNAKVYACPASTDARNLVPSDSMPHATVDSDGKYSIHDVPAGQVILIVDYDNDGIADEREFDVTVTKGHTTNAGVTEISKINKDPRGSWCDISLDKTNYSTGETLRMSLNGFNFGDAAVKCGIKIVLQKNKEYEEKWRSDFATASEYISIPAGSAGDGTILKDIPYDWEATNSSAGSNYKAYTIKEDGSVWGKYKDNFNILNTSACITDSGCDDGDPATTDVCENPGTREAKCTHTQCEIVCASDAECDDGSPITTDTCHSPNTCAASCTNLSCDVACTSDSACNDSNALTIDTCTAPNTCEASCANTACTPACGADADCNDGDSTTKDRCSNANTCSASCTHLQNLPPVAEISPDKTAGMAPLDVAFTGSCSDADGVCVSYSWDFGDGSPSVSQQNPSHTFTYAGSYIVTLTVTDNEGATSSATKTIAVSAVNSWARKFGGASDDAAWTVQQTADGGYIAGGYTASYGSGNWDAWLMMLSASGTQIWNKTFGGAGKDMFRSIRQTSDGGFIVAGFTSSTGAGGMDFWVLKLNADGDTEWSKTFGGANDEDANDVRLTPDGGFIVTGYTKSYGSGGIDSWILKLDSTGGIQWQKVLGGAGEDYLDSVELTSDGGYIFGRSIYSAGAWHGSVLKTDSSGNQQWVYDNYSYSFWTSVRPTADGGYSVSSSLTGAAGASVIYKLSSTGALLWQTTIPYSPDPASATVLAVANRPTPDGGFFLAGGAKSASTSYWDFWLAKLDSSGTNLWTKTYNVSNTEQANALELTSDSAYVIAGATANPGGDLDFYIMKLETDGSCLGDGCP